MKKKAKWTIFALSVISLIVAVSSVCLAVHRLGCIVLFDEEDDD